MIKRKGDNQLKMLTEKEKGRYRRIKGATWRESLIHYM